MASHIKQTWRPSIEMNNKGNERLLVLLRVADYPSNCMEAKRLIYYKGRTLAAWREYIIN